MQASSSPAPLISRTTLAFLMVVVAALGAGVAYWIARSEQESMRLHRQLTRAQMVEISLRQAIVGDWGVRSSLEERQRSHRSRADNLRDTAGRVRGVDPQQAGQLEMLAQQELMLSRLTGTLLMPFRSFSGSGPGSIDDFAVTQADIEKLVTDELSRLGFATTPAAITSEPEAADEPAKADGDKAPAAPPEAVTYESGVERWMLGVWRPILDAIHGLHHHVPLLALAVVFFMTALVLFTFADLVRHKPGRANPAIVAGLVATAGSLLAVLVWDVSVWRPLLVVLAASAALGGLFWLTGVFKHHTEGETTHPPEVGAHSYPGGHLILRHAHNARERTVIMMIAITVLLSSIVGYWFASAQTSASDATHRAFATDVRLNTLNGERWLQASAGAITPALELFSARLRCAYAAQAEALGAGGSTALTMLARDRERDCQALDTDAGKRAAAFVDGRAQFDTDDSPAVKVFSELRNLGPENPAHLYALADGYISLAEQWQVKSATYVLGLTLFAIALYLLSQSLGMGEGIPSLVLGACGSLLALGACVHASIVYSRPIMPPGPVPAGCSVNGSPVEVAAKYYGDARAQFESAASGPDYQRAADLFGCALAVRPDFARAQYDRSRADALVGQGDIDSTYSNFPTKARMAQIRASYRDTAAALEAAGWSPTPRFLNSQGFNTLLAGLATSDLAAVDEAAAILERAIATGGLTSADGTLDAVKLANASDSLRGIHRMLYTNLGLSRLARGNRQTAETAYRAALDGLRLAEDRPLVASSLSDLNILDGHCDSLYGETAAETCPGVRQGIGDVRRMLLLGKSAPPPGSANVSVSNIRTYAKPSRVGWSGEVSGFDPGRDTLSVVWSAYSSDWNVWRVVQPLFRNVDAKALAQGGTMNRVIVYDSSPSYCLPAGKYRAEFFLNGARIEGGDPAGVEVTPLANYRSRELDIAFCAPAGWTLAASRQNAEGRHLMREFKTPQNRTALYLFTFFAPSNAENSQIGSVNRALSLLKRLSREQPFDDGIYDRLMRFRGCDGPVAPGTMLRRQWTSGDGLAHVAFLEADAVPAGQACEVLESIGDYYNRSTAQLLARMP